MNDITIRKGRVTDAGDFARLVLHSAPKYFLRLFGRRARSIMTGLFRNNHNVFGFERSYFIEVDGRVAGMAPAYDYAARKEGLRGNFIVLKCMKWRILARLRRLIRAAGASGRIGQGELYLGSIAVYPRYRSRGLGRRLLDAVEEDGRKAGSGRLVLRAETGNSGAIKLYERCGYRTERKSAPLRISDIDFEFFRMTKDIRYN